MERNNTIPLHAAKSPTGADTLKGFLRFVLSELKPKGKIITPFNVISGIIIAVGLALIVIRFAFGLASVTNLSQEYPWGIWIGFDVVTGVAFAGGAYTLCFVVHILNFKKYEPILKATVLNGFLAYCFYAGALLLDLGRPWNVVNPIIGNAFGYSSVLFLVAWHFLLYTVCQFVEVFPAVAEWLYWPKVRKYAKLCTTGAVIFGITLSTLHQSGLGALFLMASNKIHPLWYSGNIPILFFVSSVFAGLSMVIAESTISHRVFRDQIDPHHHASFDDILIGLAKGALGALFAYFFLKVIDFVHGHQWTQLNTPMGYWWMVEMIGGIIIPIVLFTYAILKNNRKLVQVTAVITALGVILNRLNISVIAFKWYAANRYYPSWMEIWVTAAVICMEIWAFRWIVGRMPILREHPDFPEEEHAHPEEAEVVKWKASAM
ncbi:MAG: polysulfide reductase NrfD [Deltaproteobacteria bacterium]|nr:polysulfide reductase NrfD [Deltaproteobacteria bacterium]